MDLNLELTTKSIYREMYYYKKFVMLWEKFRHKHNKLSGFAIKKKPMFLKIKIREKNCKQVLTVPRCSYATGYTLYNERKLRIYLKGHLVLECERRTYCNI